MTDFAVAALTRKHAELAGEIEVAEERLDQMRADLIHLAAAIGVMETQASIANKISRGAFPAAFLLQCLEAIECRVLRLEEPS